MNPFIDNQTLVPGIMEAVRDQILRGELPVGQRLRQAALAQSLRVSPVPLREALRGLESEGLITFLPFKGAIVTPVTIQEVVETQELTMALELALVPLTLPRLSRDDFRLLRALSEELDQGNRGPETVIEFYRVLFQPAGRPQMLRIIESMIWRTVRFFPIMQSIRSKFREATPTREEMIRAFEAGDLEEAKQVLHAFHQVRVDALVAAMGVQLQRPVPPDRPPRSSRAGWSGDHHNPIQRSAT
ncbi:MAG TPA: GntR family transcriptional regulator [Holophagaceae bacterium]|nr:GntR family transcriptional regulator [Holophagaceae bacterium]